MILASSGGAIVRFLHASTPGATGRDPGTWVGVSLPHPVAALRVAAVVAAAGIPFGASAQEPGAVELARAADQQVVVVVPDEAATRGTLRRFQRADDGWRQVGGAIPVVVGSGGVGKAVEGDRKAPTGVYRLGAAFGYDPVRPPGTRLPYRALTPGSQCVDDEGSPLYNRIVDPGEVPGGKSWQSGEWMRRDLHHGDDLYRLGIVVEYNPDGTTDPSTGRGRGSCIFLHVWRDSESPTVGCTALAEGDLLELLAWLDPDARPVLVQGTRADVATLMESGLVAPGARP